MSQRYIAWAWWWMYKVNTYNAYFLFFTLFDIVEKLLKWGELLHRKLFFKKYNVCTQL